MIDKNVWHHNLILVTTLSISLVSVYSLFNHKVGNRSVARFNFPQEIPLPSWKYITNQEIAIAKKDRQEIQSANHYQYQENTTKLDIEMYYLTNTRGDVNNLLLNQTKIKPKSLETQTIKQENNGYYSLFSDRDRTYLSSCLNPTGNSTVTQKQFSDNLDRRPLNLELLGSWLLGKDSIRDRRCLWVTISTPSHSSSFLQPSDILEQVWQEWYQWWQPRFPKL